MNKKYAFVIAGLVLVIVGAVIYVAMSKGAAQNEHVTSNNQTTVNSQENKSESTSNTQMGEYVAYQEEAFGAAKEKTRLLFFHASWCPQCRELEASIKSTSLPADVVIFKVDYDSRQDLRKKYGVTLQTTIVKVDKNDNKLQSFVAYDEPSFVSVQRELLP